MTREQQKKLNAMCGDLEQQIRLFGNGVYGHVEQGPGVQSLDRDSWRWMFVGTYKGWKSVPAIEGAGFIMLGASSRTLTEAEAGDVITMLYAFGNERGVRWTDPEDQSLMAEASKHGL